MALTRFIIFKKRSLTLNILLCISFAALSLVKGYAVTKTATAGTDWSTATWSPVGLPGTGDDVIINSGINLNISTAAVCGSLTIGNATNTATTITLITGGSLVVSGTSGNLTINPNNNVNTYILAVAALTITIAGSPTFLSATDSITLTTGTINFTKAAGFTWTTGLLSMSAGGNVNFTGPITLSSGTIRNRTTVGTMTFSGGLTKTGGTLGTIAGGTVKIGGNLTVSGTALTFASQVTFTGNSTVTPTAAITINGHIIVNVSTVVTLAGNITLGNINLSINGTYDMMTYTSNRGSGGGLLTFGASGVLKLGGSSGGQTGSNFPLNFTSLTLPQTSTVEYNSANGVNQTIYSSGTGVPLYGILTLSNSTGSGSTTKTAGNNIFCYYLTINSNTTFAGSAFLHEVRRNWTNSGTFNSSTGTVRFDRQGVAGTSTITNAAGEIFYNLIVANAVSNTNVLLANNISIINDFTISGGILDLSTYSANRTTSGGSFGVAAGAKLKLGAASGGQSGSNFPLNFTTVTLNSTSTVEYNSATGVAQTIFAVGSGYGNLTLSNITGSGNSNKTVTTGLIINGALTLSDAFTTFNSTSATHTLGGNWINNGTFNHQSGQITISNATTVSGTSVTSFNNLLINNLSTLTGPSAANMNVAGNFINNGTFTHNDCTVTFSGTTVLSGTAISSFKNLIISGTLTGVASGNYNIAGDFTNNGTYTDNSGTVTFNGSANQNIAGTATSTDFYNLTISNTGTTFIESTSNLINALTLTGTSIFDADGTSSNKIFTLKSTSNTNTARIASIPALASVIGNVTVERFILGTSTGWGLLGPPVGAQTIGDWAGTGEILTSCPSGCTGSANNFQSVYYFDETLPTTSAGLNEGYIACTNATGLTSGKGYWLWIADNLSTAANRTVKVTGVPNTGDQPIAVTFTDGDPNFDGYNLISNPFPSPISWTSLEADAGTPANISNTIYAYNADLNGGLGDWASYTIGGASVPALGSGGIDDNIPTSQGFYVTLTGATTLTAKETHKTSTNNPFLKINADVNANGDLLRFFLDGGSCHTEMAVQFNDKASVNFDGAYDAYRFASLNPLASSISTILNDTAYHLNSLPPTKNYSIPLKVKVGKTGTFTISISDISVIPGIYTSVILEDKLTGINTELKTTGSYSFNISDTTRVPRFIIHFFSEALFVRNSDINGSNVFITLAGDQLICRFEFNKAEKIVITGCNSLGQKILGNVEYEVFHQTISIPIPLEANGVLFVSILSPLGNYTKPVFRQ